MTKSLAISNPLALSVRHHHVQSAVTRGSFSNIDVFAARVAEEARRVDLLIPAPTLPFELVYLNNVVWTEEKCLEDDIDPALSELQPFWHSPSYLLTIQIEDDVNGSALNCAEPYTRKVHVDASYLVN